MKKQLSQGKAESSDPALHIEMETLRQEREERLNAEEAQAEREQQIGEAYQLAGEIRAFTFTKKVVTVARLMRLKVAKEGKVYRDLPGIGTWDKYCDYLGLDRHTVDEKLRQLDVFGAQFLETCQQFSISHRDLRQLRQLKYDGESFQMSDDGKTVVIEGEAISLGEDAAPEIEAALEKLLEKNKTLRERNTKLEKDLKGAVKEETAGLLSEKKALLERVKTLEVFEPKSDDREWSIKGMQRIEETAAALQLAIAGFLIDEHVSTDRHIQARVDAHLREAEMALHDVRTRLDDTIGMYND